jgi:LmbE family N-acetylglucosaminyl deacetylase
MPATTLTRTTPTVITGPADAAQLGTVLGVWAHPDDEAYLSAGLMAMARAAGSSVVCVTATAGDHGTDDPGRFPPDVLAPIRRAELAAALRSLDVREHRVLGLTDGTLAELDPEPQVTRLRRLIAWFQPDTIVTFGPDGMTGHPDHRTVSAWTTAAWRAASCAGRLLYATTTDAFADEFAHLHDRLPVFGPGLPLRTPADELAVAVHVAGPHLDAKERALHSHASQVDVLLDAFGREEYRRWWRTETFIAAPMDVDDRRAAQRP